MKITFASFQNLANDLYDVAFRAGDLKTFHSMFFGNKNSTFSPWPAAIGMSFGTIH